MECDILFLVKNQASFDSKGMETLTAKFGELPLILLAINTLVVSTMGTRLLPVTLS
jgi:hypothetical protein